MLAIRLTSSTTSQKGKRFYSSGSLMDPRKHFDISTWIILAVALLILSSAFVILYLVWRNQRNARKQALEGEVQGGMTFGEEYGVDLCKVNDEFRQFVEKEEMGQSGTEMGEVNKSRIRIQRRPSSPLSGKTLNAEDEIVEQSFLRCPPSTPSSVTTFGITSPGFSPNKPSGAPIPTCKPDRNDRESTVERELIEIEKEGKPRGGWWSATNEQPQELPRGGSRDFGSRKLVPVSELCSSPSDITPTSPVRLPAIFQSRAESPVFPTRSESPAFFQPCSESPEQIFSSPETISSTPPSPARITSPFRGLPSSPSAYVSAPLPPIPPRAASRGRSPIPAPIDTTRLPKQTFEKIEEDISTPLPNSFPCAQTRPQAITTRNPNIENTQTPHYPPLPGQTSASNGRRTRTPTLESNSDYVDVEIVELQPVPTRDASPEPELGMGREIHIRKSSGRISDFSPRLSQCPTAIGTPGMFSPVFITPRSPPLERIRSRSPSPFSPGSPPTHLLKMNKVHIDPRKCPSPDFPEPLHISTDDITTPPPSASLPAPPTPRTQQAQAVGAAMVHLLNGRIQQHRLMQNQSPAGSRSGSVSGMGGEDLEERVREVSEVQSLAWAEKRGWGGSLGGRARILG